MLVLYSACLQHDMISNANKKPIFFLANLANKTKLSLN